MGLRDALSGMCASLSSEPLLPPPLRAAAAAVSTKSSRVPLILSSLLVITAIACAVRDMGVVVGVSGALLGGAIVYTMPSLIYISACGAATPPLIYLLPPLGIFFGILGASLTLQSA